MHCSLVHRSQKQRDVRELEAQASTVGAVSVSKASATTQL